jgi:hypothetical protein
MMQPTAIANMEIRSTFEFVTDGAFINVKRFAADRWVISSREADGGYRKGAWITRGNATEYGRSWLVCEFDAAANGVTISEPRTPEAAISDAVSHVAA